MTGLAPKWILDKLIWGRVHEPIRVYQWLNMTLWLWLRGQGWAGRPEHLYKCESIPQNWLRDRPSHHEVFLSHDGHKTRQQSCRCGPLHLYCWKLSLLSCFSIPFQLDHVSFLEYIQYTIHSPSYLIRSSTASFSSSSVLTLQISTVRTRINEIYIKDTLVYTSSFTIHILHLCPDVTTSLEPHLPHSLPIYLNDNLEQWKHITITKYQYYLKMLRYYN